jgi:class 3 adenylate cyclase
LTGTPATIALDDAQRAYGLQDYAGAVRHYEEAARSGPLDPESLSRLALARWLTGHLSEYTDLLERAHEGFVAAGDRRGAAMRALDLARFHMMKLGGAAAEAWMRRAHALVEGDADSPAGGQLTIHAAMAAQAQGDFETSLVKSRHALELGTRIGDRDIQAMALMTEGRTLIRMGRVAEGKALLDEAMVAAVGGDLTTMVTGVIYCNTIDACADLADYGRAGEWTDAAQRWCARKSVSGFPGMCRVHQAEIMRLRGNWADAETAARKACCELEEYSYVMIAASAQYEIGEIRLRMGDLQGAEEAFAQAAAMGRDPEPGRAMLRLARGKTAAAAAAIRRALDDAVGPLARIRLLPAAVRIALASSPTVFDEVEALVVEIEATADRFESAAFRACAQTARGALLLAQGEASSASASLRAGVKLWTGLDLPHEAALARLQLACAYRAEGDEEAARTEAEAARATFERLGAVLDAQRARATVSAGAAPAEDGERESVTFMFTDIVGSTGLVSTLGDAAWSTLLRWHDDALRASFAEHGGREIKHTGDGFHVAFDAPESAVTCAIAIQRLLDEHRRAHGFAPEVRIGVHATTATRAGSDFAGKGVHEAARIGAHAQAGEILASLHTALAGANAAAITAQRQVELKGISEPVQLASIAWSRGATGAPSASPK